MKVIIVGGVAGGASCAARLRRLDEKAEILLVERGPYVSYANCGLPYHVGDVIEKESSLLVANAQTFRLYNSFTDASGTNRKVGFYFPAVIAPKLSIAMKNEDFTSQNIELEVMADTSGNTYYFFQG